MKALARIAAALAALSLVGCTVHNTEAPTLSGPSELGLSVTVSATPDSISQDGGAQSSIKVTSLGSNGQIRLGDVFRIDMRVNGVVVDYGTLSARTIVTGSDGVARTVYTAPPAPAGGITGTCRSLPGTCVEIVATLIGPANPQMQGTFQTAVPQSTLIRLVPTGVILPPAGSPTAAFTSTPTPAVANVPLLFDASTSLIGAGATQIASYDWTFGDGTSGTGKTPSHTFTAPNTYNVTLTVTNDRGLSASTTQAVAVGQLLAPSAVFVFSPTAPTVGQVVVFNADGSRAAAGHTLTQYSWIFGDGTTGSGLLVSHVFAVTGTYNVTLSVLDDTGQKATAALTVTISLAAGGVAGSPIPGFTSSPTTPVVNEVVVFDSSASTVAPGRTITDYAWNFGDDTPIIHGDNRIISHQFGRSDTFIVNLVLTDSAGATGQRSASVTVGSGNPVPVLVLTKTGGNGIVGDGSASTANGTATITNYTFFWGDGTQTSGAAPAQAKAYAVAGTYSVTLRVTDSLGRVGTSATQPITVP